MILRGRVPTKKRLLDSMTQKTQDDTSIEAILARSRHKDLIERVWEWKPMGHRERERERKMGLKANESLQRWEVFTYSNLSIWINHAIQWYFGVFFRPEQKNTAFNRLVMEWHDFSFVRKLSTGKSWLGQSWWPLLSFARWVLKHFGTCHRKIPMSFDVRRDFGWCTGPDFGRIPPRFFFFGGRILKNIYIKKGGGGLFSPPGLVSKRNGMYWRRIGGKNSGRELPTSSGDTLSLGNQCWELRF